ncbi:MAG: NusG domain II-containing protein [Oscillospiraceae bacterium]|nr:NusG domain II-containing protein [Oscillospiraceae bacterium]
MKRLITVSDFIVIGIILLAAVLLLLFKSNEIGKTAVIRVDGKEYKTVSLTNDGKTEISVNGVLIVYGGGEIYVENSTCHDKICVNAGHLSKKGQSAVCVPNRVSVEIVGNDKSAPKAVTG